MVGARTRATQPTSRSAAGPGRSVSIGVAREARLAAARARSIQCPIKMRLRRMNARDATDLTHASTTVPNQDVTTASATTRPSVTSELGRPPCRRRSETKPTALGEAARRAAGAQRSPSGSRHDSRRAPPSVAPFDRHVHGPGRRARAHEQSSVSADAVLGSDGSPAPHRRGGVA